VQIAILTERITYLTAALQDPQERSSQPSRAVEDGWSTRRLLDYVKARVSIVTRASLKDLKSVGKKSSISLSSGYIAFSFFHSGLQPFLIARRIFPLLLESGNARRVQTVWRAWIKRLKSLAAVSLFIDGPNHLFDR